MRRAADGLACARRGDHRHGIRSRHDDRQDRWVRMHESIPLSGLRRLGAAGLVQAKYLRGSAKASRGQFATAAQSSAERSQFHALERTRFLVLCSEFIVRKTVEEHARKVPALKRCDGERAARVVRQHLAAVATKSRRFASRRPAPFDE